METIDTLIIGAGVIGLALARRLSAEGPLAVLESEWQAGTQLSSHNSEVIHAGLYYPPDSGKASLCVSGMGQLYDYAKAKRIPYRRCGKLVLACDHSEEAGLQALYQRARENGVEGLSLLNRRALARQEPWLSCHAALHSEHSGIIDSHTLMQQLAKEAQENGALLGYRQQVINIALSEQGFRVTVRNHSPVASDYTLCCRRLINAAGLGAVPLLHAMDGFPAEQLPHQRFARGNYYNLRGRSPSQRLIYPLPDVHGLGIHLTVDLAGQARFGPDVEWLDQPDWRVNETRRQQFVSAIRRYWPSLDADRLSPAYAGLRPKLFFDNTPLTDFLIQGPAQHGLPGLINLLGIESPGLTAALAIADRVYTLLNET
ncbi:MAG: NAD(P)/FAD-dependent oxidoreductase [Alcanivorax sp.]|nr:NAD(P)/FAD-dependent oxidoreductase [Alcanivorax sp.]